MKRLKHLTLLAFVLIVAMRGFGQKVKLEDGDLSPLKSEKTIAFAFSYDSMMIGSGKDIWTSPWTSTSTFTWATNRGGIRCKTH